MGLRRSLAMMFLFIVIVVTPSVRCSPPLGNGVLISQDTLRPEISAWGIVGDPSSGDSFSVWANVSDSGSGVRNVSLVTRQDTGNITITELFPSDSLYSREVLGLPVNHTYSLSILAFDIANNSATSYSIVVNTYPPSPPSFDSNVAMPGVVISSLLLAVCVVAITVFYQRRQINGVH